MAAFAEDQVFGYQHIPQHTDPERYFIVVEMIYPIIVKQDMVHPETHGGHGHAVTADHPVLMCQHIFLPDRLQAFGRAVKPVNGHEKK